MNPLDTRNLLFTWAEFFHQCLKDGKLESPVESGYSSRRNSLESDEMILSTVCYKIACKFGGCFQGVTKELHVSRIPEDLELETTKLCARIGHKKFLMCFRAGFSDCISVVLRKGVLAPLAKFPRLCELLTREWRENCMRFDSKFSNQARLHDLISVVICIEFYKPSVRDLTLSVTRTSEQPPKTRCLSSSSSPESSFSSPESSSSSPESSLGEESPPRPRAKKPLGFAPEGPVAWSKEALQFLKNSYSNDGPTPKSVLLKCFDPTVIQERILYRSELRCGWPSFFPPSVDYSAIPICPYAVDFLKTDDRNPALSAEIRRATNFDLSWSVKFPPGGDKSKMFGEWSPP